MSILKDGDIVLFQGDSITDGNRGRNSDPNHILGHGYQFILAAELTAKEPEKNVKFINRGISGNRIADLYGRWKEDALNLNPTILSIMIGVNDVGFEWDHKSGSEPERFKKIYRLLLDESTQNNPDMQIIIMEPFYEAPDSSERSKFFASNTKKIAKAAREIAEEYGAIFVPLQEMFDEYCKKSGVVKFIWDGVHPTYTGHGLIAEQWKKYALPILEARK